MRVRESKSDKGREKKCSEILCNREWEKREIKRNRERRDRGIEREGERERERGRNRTTILYTISTCNKLLYQ